MPLWRVPVRSQLAFKAIPAALGVSVRRSLAMNSLTVPRAPGEAAGAICKLVRKDAPPLVINVRSLQLEPRTGWDAGLAARRVLGLWLGWCMSRSPRAHLCPPFELWRGQVEYNQLEPLLKASGLGGDSADATGSSPYPGNVNTLIFALEPYAAALEATGGAMPEFVNPKYANPEKTIFKKPTRLECMMQVRGQRTRPSHARRDARTYILSHTAILSRTHPPDTRTSYHALTRTHPSRTPIAQTFSHTRALAPPPTRAHTRTQHRAPHQPPPSHRARSQDFPKLLSPDVAVGFTSFERWFSFSPVKNSIDEAIAADQKGVFAASPGAGEAAVYDANARLLRLAGADVAPPAPPSVHLGLPLALSPAIALTPNFAITVDEIFSRVAGGSAVRVSDRSRYAEQIGPSPRPLEPFWCPPAPQTA